MGPRDKILFPDGGLVCIVGSLRIPFFGVVAAAMWVGQLR